MNYEENRDTFATIMLVTWQSCGSRTKPSKEVMQYWFSKLMPYSMQEVEMAFDNWLKSQSTQPTIHDILKLCQHKITIFSKLPSPLVTADNKRHANEVVDYVAKNIKKEPDRRAWARKIISGEFKSNWGGAIDFAKLALNMPLDKS